MGSTGKASELHLNDLWRRGYTITNRSFVLSMPISGGHVARAQNSHVSSAEGMQCDWDYILEVVCVVAPIALKKGHIFY